MRIIGIYPKRYRPILVEVIEGHRVWMSVMETNAIMAPGIVRLSEFTQTKNKNMKKLKQIMQTERVARVKQKPAVFLR